MSANAVTATVTPSHLATRRAAPDDQAFMDAVVAWPGSDERGYINLHWSSPKGPGLRGRPFKDIHQFMSMEQHAANKPGTYKEIYFCLSTQDMTGKVVNGYVTAHRSKQHAIFLKSVWLDIDVKDDGKHYATLAEAVAALNQFVTSASQPVPSALVFSGGGVHVYWISKTPLTTSDWRPFAEGLKAEAIRLGLKCDAALTTDEARILRVPGTFNNKEPVPRPVVLKHLGDLYDFPTDLAHLPPVAPVAAHTKITAPTVMGAPFDLSKFTGKAMCSLMAHLDPQDSLAEGLNLRSDLPLEIAEIVKHCPHFADTMVTHGAGQSEPLWQLTLLGCTFLDGGRRWAHYVSKGYPTYSKAETDAKYDQKLTQRAQGNVGWPSCDAFESAGCKHCKTCPFHGKIKSPLNLANKATKQTENRNEQAAQPCSDDKWPDGYSKAGTPVKGYANTLVAFRRLGIKFTYDIFRQKEFSAGHSIDILNGELSDRTVTMLRDQIRSTHGFYPDKEIVREAITAECLRNRTNPVLDYFDRLTWDGIPRLSTFLHDYLGAEDTPLNGAIGIKLMCAIVRRARRPGCKYDHQVVLQSDQGFRKSMFCEDLAVSPDLFTDAGEFGGSIKEFMEVAQGKQIIEFAEMAGHSQGAREKSKSMLSRRVDRARMAYGHYAKDEPRSSIPIGTTNPGGYLNDPTGERRYWHVAVSRYNREGFLAVKDQLYAEAVAREPQEKLWLDTPNLVKAHDAIVATVKEDNLLVDELAELSGDPWETGRDKIEGGWLIHREERISNKDVRAKLGIYGVDALRMRELGKRISDAMLTLGWTKVGGTLVCKRGGTAEGGYRRPLPDEYKLEEAPSDHSAVEPSPMDEASTHAVDGQGLDAGDAGASRP